MVRSKALCMLVAVLAAAQAWPESARMKHGRQVYADSCASCHDDGTDGAPSIRKPEDWGDRSSLWEGVLFEHANTGYLSMPAKGGAAGLTEDDVDAAAEYMLTVVHPELPKDY